MSQPSIRVNSRTGPEHFCFRGNEELANNRPQVAIKYYTHVLHELCPGHICALLNRCLAYVLLGYPELAVYDAYAAVTLAYQCRDLWAPTNGPLIADTLKYATAEREAAVGGTWRWLDEDATNVGSDWMTAPLAAMLLIPHFAPSPDDPPPPANLVPSPPPMPSVEEEQATPSPILPPTPQVLRMMDMFRKLEIMAMWRLIGSLRQCGCGALSDALAMVDDVKRKFRLSANDQRYFDNMGDLIMREVQANYEGDPINTEILMSTKMTMVNRVVYPWNKHEPDVDTFTDLGIAPNPEGAQSLEKPYAIRRKPADSSHAACLRLVAARDIFPGELVLIQTHPLQVTTKPPAKSESETYHCDACAGIMISSHQARRNPHLARFKIPGEEESDCDASGSDNSSNVSKLATSDDNNVMIVRVEDAPEVNMVPGE